MFCGCTCTMNAAVICSWLTGWVGAAGLFLVLPGPSGMFYMQTPKQQESYFRLPLEQGTTS